MTTYQKEKIILPYLNPLFKSFRIDIIAIFYANVIFAWRIYPVCWNLQKSIFRNRLTNGIKKNSTNKKAQHCVRELKQNKPANTTNLISCLHNSNYCTVSTTWYGIFNPAPKESVSGHATLPLNIFKYQLPWESTFKTQSFSFTDFTAERSGEIIVL